MSAVSFPLSSPSPEPAVSRRRAPDTEPGREAVPFSLPEEPAADEKAPAAEEGADTKRGEPAAAQAQKGEASSTPASTQPTAAKPSAVSAPATPSQPAGAGAPAQVVAQPQPNVGALVAIAEAEQAVTGEIGETIAKPKKAEGEGEEATAEGADAGAAMPIPMPDAAAATPVQPTPVLPAAIAGEAQAPVSTEAVAPGAQGAPGQQSAGIQFAMVPVATVREAPLAPGASAAAGEAAPEPAPASEPASGKTLRLAAVTKLPVDLAALGLAGASSPGTDSAVAKAAGEAKPAEGAGSSHVKSAKGETTDASASTAAATTAGEIVKPAEAPPQQPVPTAIDFSAIAHQRAGKPEALPGVDQTATAAQQQIAGNQHGAADGQPTPLHVVPMEIGLRALAGSKRFDIRLDPAELGRVDVKLEISDKGEVSAKLVVDRVETLHLLQRDARTLERAFEQAGLKPSDAGVDITLRDQSGFRQNRQDEQAPRRPQSASEAEIDDIAISAQPTPIRRLVRLGGVDLSI